MRVTARSLVVVLAIAVVPGLASAQTDPEAEARVHFRKGTVHYNLGRFDDAIREYKKAYELSSTAILLFNIAQAYRLKGDLDQALFFYRSYLRNTPKAPNRREVTERIAALQKLVAARDRAATAPPHGALAPSGEPPPPKPGRRVGAEPAPPAPEPTPSLGLTPPPPEPRPEPTVHPAVAMAKAMQPTEDVSRPIYRKWWFWGGVGAVIVGVVVGSVLAAILPNSTLQSDCAFGIGRLGCAKAALR